MADDVTMSIGPTGQPPTTVYTYSAGGVTLSPRVATVRTVPEVASIVARIEAFVAAVKIGQVPPFTQPDTPFRYRVDASGPPPVVYACTFRAGPLNTASSVDTAAKTVAFDARPQVVLAWSDFELFAGWMRFLLTLAARPTIY